jgi:hypothetical protein
MRSCPGSPHRLRLHVGMTTILVPQSMDFFVSRCGPRLALCRCPWLTHIEAFRPKLKIS